MTLLLDSVGLRPLAGGQYLTFDLEVVPLVLLIGGLALYLAGCDGSTSTSRATPGRPSAPPRSSAAWP